MKALFFDGRVSIAELPLPQPKTGEALIKVLRAGICRTDLEIIEGYMNFQGILGHEFVGLVEESPSSFLRGKRVVGEINIGCDECAWCLANLSRHCPHRRVLGIKGKDGAFAQYLTLPEKNLHLLPQTMSDDEGVFVEPLAAAFEIEEQIIIKPEDSVAVIGDGRLGQLVAQLIHLRGCSLLAIGKHRNKLRLLEKIGISTELFSERIEEKFDLIVECSGSPQGLELALKLIKPRGRIILKSTINRPYSFDFTQVVINEVQFIGSRCGPFEPAIKLLDRGLIKVEQLISAHFSLEQGLEALQFVRQKKGIKVILTLGK